MQSEFEMTDLGIMKYFLGIEVHQSAKVIFVCQQKYAADIIKLLFILLVDVKNNLLAFSFYNLKWNGCK
jgi:hypothetical protein